jgi:hypothetical protein
VFQNEVYLEKKKSENHVCYVRRRRRRREKKEKEEREEWI